VTNCNKELQTILENITIAQKQAIDNKDADGLRKCISMLTVGATLNRKWLIDYCEYLLNSLNVGNAMIEESDLSDFGDM